MSKPQITVSNNTNISDEWYTPSQIINRIQQFYQDSYWLDVASNEIAQTYIKANQYIDREIDALNIHTSWKADAIWMNPPYSRTLIKEFACRFLKELDCQSFYEGIVLVNSCTDTLWFHSLACKADVRIDIKGRLYFWHPDKANKNPIAGSTLFYFGENQDVFFRYFGDLGLCYKSVVYR